MRNVVCFFLIAILFSCQKENINNDKNIAAWTQHIPEQNRDLYQIRLAFGKTLAKALKERELRDFIKQQSKIQGERIYKELVFALIKDEVLPSGKTVMQVVREHEDCEVKELFGETLMDRVANDDPMVAIKLPDVFHQYDWDTQNVTPFVGVETPSRIKVGQWELHFAFYPMGDYLSGGTNLDWIVIVDEVIAPIDWNTYKTERILDEDDGDFYNNFLAIKLGDLDGNALDQDVDILDPKIVSEADSAYWRKLPQEVFNASIVPNPFSDESVLSFDLPSHQLVNVAITDMNGQKVYATQIEGIAGKNQLILDNEMIRKSGLYLVKLNGLSGNKVIKLIKVK